MSTTRPIRRRTSASPTVRSLRAAEPAHARPAAIGAHRELLAPPSASATWRASGRRTRRWGRRLRMTRRRALVMLALSLVVLLGGTLAVSAATPGSGLFAAQPV